MSGPKRKATPKPAAKKAPARKTPPNAGAKASRGSAESGPRVKSAARPGPKRPAPRRGPTPSDLLGVLVLIGTASLAACGWMRQGGSDSGSATSTKPAAPGGEVVIRFLDVGQGDSVLIQSPEGKTALIDGGRSTERMRDHIAELGLEKLDLMIASHADADHIAGLVPAAALKPRVFVNNGLGGTTQTWERLVKALQDVDATFTKASNQTVNLGSVKLRLIAPPPGMGDDQNENSVGVALQFGEFRALMTGDSETPETEGWLAQDRDDLRGPFQVYKSIHHGAANGDSAAWLANVRPQNVVISVGTPNSYGHPTSKALNLYKQAAARVYRTDRQGTITFRGQADGTYTADTER
ncbi:MBL fold metallo-hydrolase [Deinococcus taeanensis]|uniref:ComEC/Rec2 family competence protein n=1 Tax=Deinococcus taeanensis TaxID=2737050 RepID=UPI001CDD4043|nr:ComEC/Rec2 family competence protein [Deinococcus taeanensis]UBV42743.1 MBL fold metallo-hydrolase [Deinococcus taeanensis]